MRLQQSFSAAHPTAAFPSLVRVIAHCVLFFVVCSFRCFATSDNPLQIELVSSVTSIQPGTPFRVGLHLKHPEGYHTYWKFPGIVGVPTSMAWQLPDGWKAEPIEWPAPERVFMFEIKAQGFHGDKVLPMSLTPPGDLKYGSKITLKGKATWMCCGRDCNPGFRELSLELSVSADPPKVDERWASAFDAAASAMATDCPDWRAQASINKDQLVLAITPESEAARTQLTQIKEVTFFTEDGLIDPNKPTKLKVTPDRILLTQTLSEYAPKPLPRRVFGILQSPEHWLPGEKPNTIIVNVALTNSAP